jgi:hypothetical protein
MRIPQGRGSGNRGGSLSSGPKVANGDQGRHRQQDVSSPKRQGYRSTPARSEYWYTRVKGEYVRCREARPSGLATRHGAQEVSEAQMAVYDTTGWGQ